MTGMDTSTSRLFEQVRRNAEGTPYTVTETEKGFDVALDLADATWYEVFGKAGLRVSFTHHVAVHDDRYTITDDSRQVHWRAGVPTASAGASRFVGRQISFSSRKTWALLGTPEKPGVPTKVVDYTFSTETGRALITGAATSLGLRQEMPLSEKVGIGFGIVGAVGAVVTLVVLAVYALLGKF